MKIIKKVEIGTWKYIFTCGKCDSELEADAHDIIHVHSSGDMREPSCDTYHVICMVCNNKHGISGNTIPKLVQLEAQKRSSNAPVYL